MSQEHGEAARGRLEVETPESVAFSFELAGLGSRGVALSIDFALLGSLFAAEGLLAALLAVALIVSRLAAAVQIAIWIAAGTLVLMFLTAWGYFIYGEVLRNGRTYGKRRMGIRVVRDDGSRVTFLDSFLRNTVRLVDVLPGSHTIGVIAILLSSRNKRLGDMAAGTVVVREQADAPLYFDGSTLSEKDSLAREYLGRRGLLTAPGREQVAAELLAAYGEEPGPGWDEPMMAGRLADLSGARLSD